MTFRTPATLLLLACTVAVPAAASTGSAKTMYERVLEREQSLRNANQPPTVAEIRGVVSFVASLPVATATMRSGRPATWRLSRSSASARRPIEKRRGDTSRV